MSPPAGLLLRNASGAAVYVHRAVSPRLAPPSSWTTAMPPSRRATALKPSSPTRNALAMRKRRALAYGAKTERSTSLAARVFSWFAPLLAAGRRKIGKPKLAPLKKADAVGNGVHRVCWLVATPSALQLMRL
jgi:hypothetical protein